MGLVVDIEEGTEQVEEDEAAEDDAPIACWLGCFPPCKKFCDMYSEDLIGLVRGCLIDPPSVFVMFLK